MCSIAKGLKAELQKPCGFSTRSELGREVYNLAFGDYDEHTDRLDDKIVSDNGDRERILYTIAKCGN